MTDDFVSWHTHSDMSQLDGCGRIEDYVRVAKERGHQAIAFSDHGTLRGILAQHEQCEEHGVKPIFGTEFYVAKNMRRKGLTPEEKADLTKNLKKGEYRDAIKDYEEREGIRDRWHLTVWAQNETGLKNLYRLSSLSFLEGFYYKPRIDLDELIKYGDGLIVASGCLASPISDSWVAGRRRQAIAYADRLHEAFGDRFLLEVQPHAIADQRLVNELMLKLRDRYKGARLLATQDAHYVEQSDAEHHEVLLCVGTRSTLSNPNRFKFDGDEFHFRTRKEMRRAFARHHEFIPAERVKEALDTTIELAQTCDAKLEIDYRRALLPNPGIPKRYEGNHTAYLKDLCLQGWTWRQIPRRAAEYAERNGITLSEAIGAYAERLKRELKVISSNKFVRYFLVIRDICRFVRESEIMMGPGRGSVGGSLVAFLIGITAIDPLEHRLMFERFLAPGRKDLPDADLDFEDRRRGEIIEYLRQKYGSDNVCQIATVGKLSGKECVRSVSRVLEVPLLEVNAITGSIIDRAPGDERAHQTVEDSFAEFEVCKAFHRKYPKVLHHARRLEGLAKTLGIHAAGVVTSPIPLTELLPLEVRKHADGDVVVSAYDMHGVAKIGLVKIDVLGLRTLAVMRDALSAIKERHGLSVNLETDVELNDAKVLKAFTDHDFVGIFQFDTPSADKLTLGIEFRTFDDLAAIIALNRPGPINAGLAEKFIERRKNPKLEGVVDYHPAVSEITADTLGVIVYQEHVLRIFSEIAGFSAERADEMRRVIGKKVGDETLNKERPAFVAGAMKHTAGMSERTANAIMDAIIKFGSYGFNRAHSVGYAVIATWAQWLKVYYPVEFYFGLLKNEPDRDSIKQIAKDAARHGIEVVSPHVSVSAQTFVIDGDKRIRGSLQDIKGVGAGAVETIVANQPFKDIYDFAARIDRRKCNRGAVVALAKAGALEGLLPNTKWFVENAEKAWACLLGKRKRDTAERARWMLEELSAKKPDYSAPERIRISAEVNPLTFGHTLLDAYRGFVKRNLKAPVAKSGSETYWDDFDGRGHLLLGVIAETKIHHIGDFELQKDEARRKAPVWGQPYAHVTFETADGPSLRVKVDFDAFESCKDVLYKGGGRAVLFHATASARNRSLRAQFVVDVETLKRKLAAEEALTVWERIAIGKHPAKTYAWKDETERARALTNETFLKSRTGGFFLGVVTHVRLQADRRGDVMAYFGLLGADFSYIEATCFASSWPDVAHVVRPGNLIKVQLERQRDQYRGGFSNLFNGGRIKWFRKGQGSKEKSDARLSGDSARGGSQEARSGADL